MQMMSIIYKDDYLLVSFVRADQRYKCHAIVAENPSEGTVTAMATAFATGAKAFTIQMTRLWVNTKDIRIPMSHRIQGLAVQTLSMSSKS